MARSNWRFISLVLLAVPLTILAGYGEVVDEVIHPFTQWTARIVLTGIRLLGIEATLEGTVIRNGAGFAYEITGRCAGVVPLTLLAIGIIVANVSAGRKFVGASIGLPALIIVNWARLVSLFWLGVNQPASFGFAHDVIWQLIMGAATVMSWYLWRSDRGYRVFQIRNRVRSDGSIISEG